MYSWPLIGLWLRLWLRQYFPNFSFDRTRLSKINKLLARFCPNLPWLFNSGLQHRWSRSHLYRPNAVKGKFIVHFRGTLIKSDAKTLPPLSVFTILSLNQTHFDIPNPFRHFIIFKMEIWIVVKGKRSPKIISAKIMNYLIEPVAG